MNIKLTLSKLFNFYREGFKSMTLGKTLWKIILIKLFIMFAILKVFFFPNLLSKYKTQDEKAIHVVNELLKTDNNNK